MEFSISLFYVLKTKRVHKVDYDLFHCFEGLSLNGGATYIFLTPLDNPPAI